MESTWWSVDFVLVFEARRREVACRDRPARRHGERVIKGIWTGWFGAVISQRISRWWLVWLPRLANRFLRSRVIVSFLLQPGRQSLDHVHFEQTNQVGEACCRDEDASKGVGKAR
jgi:hypothetical protein